MSNFIVGLTGGIGCGKTTITNMFAQLGVDIIDADIVARQIVAPKTKALNAIAEHFGSTFITDTGELNRSLLRSKIFSNNDDKKWLNNLLHPLIRQTIQQQISQAKSDYCILVAPLLIENKLNKMVDKVLVVDVDESTQLARTLKRDTSNEQEIKAIIASQISRQTRLAAADDIIDNTQTDLHGVEKAVKKLAEYYLSLAQAKHS